MSGKRFLDTNIFVCCFDSSDKGKQLRAQDVVARALQDRQSIVSWQVVQEFLNAATRKFERPMAASEARAYLETVLAPLCEVFPSIEIYQRALELRERAQLSFYDALMVAAALEANCTHFLSEDLQAGQRIDGLVVQNPFAS
ncbi:MAG: PIN domain-containing protein [Verrucomicrobiota bacterium]